MNVLGENIDIDIVLEGAKSIALVSYNMPDSNIDEKSSVIEKMYDGLARMAEYVLYKSDLIIAYGECFVGVRDPWAETYTEPILGEEAGVAGFYKGVTSVFVTEPVTEYGVRSHIVPALEIEVVDHELSDVYLGSAQLYSKVAIPLFGQSPVLFRNRNVISE